MPSSTTLVPLKMPPAVPQPANAPMSASVERYFVMLASLCLVSLLTVTGSVHTCQMNSLAPLET